MRMQRLIGLVNILADAEKMTVQELADHFQVSKRTIFRDLNVLNSIGIPVVSCPATGEGALGVNEYRIDKTVFSKDDTLKLFEISDKSGKQEEYKNKDHCPCKKACRYHGSCKECVAIHRAHRKHVPNCMRPSSMSN